jgi:uncharacterized phage-associated protein
MFEPETDIEFDYEKFRAVVHFICHECRPEELGRVKLHKILYFSDFLRYLEAGAPLTGEDYIKQKFGPTARHLNKALRELQQNGSLRISERPFHGYTKQLFDSLKSPATNLVSEDEAKLLRDVIGFACGRTASEMSELSHSEPWEMAATGERIPYYMAFSFVPAELTDEDFEWARGEARRHGVLA